MTGQQIEKARTESARKTVRNGWQPEWMTGRPTAHCSQCPSSAESTNDLLHSQRCSARSVRSFDFFPFVRSHFYLFPYYRFSSALLSFLPPLLSSPVPSGPSYMYFSPPHDGLARRNGLVQRARKLKVPANSAPRRRRRWSERQAAEANAEKRLPSTLFSSSSSRSPPTPVCKSAKAFVGARHKLNTSLPDRRTRGGIEERNPGESWTHWRGLEGTDRRTWGEKRGSDRDGRRTAAKGSSALLKTDSTNRWTDVQMYGWTDGRTKKKETNGQTLERTSCNFGPVTAGAAWSKAGLVTRCEERTSGARTMLFSLSSFPFFVSCFSRELLLDFGLGTLGGHRNKHSMRVRRRGGW